MDPKTSRFSLLFHRILWHVLSVPIYTKVLGIGLLVTLLFGALSLYQTRIGMLGTHYKAHGETAWAAASSLAERIAPYVAAGRTSALDHALRETMEMMPSVRYVFIEDPKGHILSHGSSFPIEAPSDLVESVPGRCSACHDASATLTLPRPLTELSPQTPLGAGFTRAFKDSQGMVLEVVGPHCRRDGRDRTHGNRGPRHAA